MGFRNKESHYKQYKEFFTTLVVFYVLVLTFLFFNQRILMYIPQGTDTLPAEIGLTDFEQVSFSNSDYEVILWEKKPDNDVKTYVVFFHGNGGSLHNRKNIFLNLTQGGEGLVAISYPGYGASGGSPSEESIYRASQKSIEHLTQQGVKTSDMIFFGESLGTAVAIEMATRFTPKKLILQSPFTNMVEAASYHYPYVMGMKYMVLDEYDSISKVDKINTETIVIHGKNDGVVPFKMGKALFEAFKEPKSSLFIDRVGHQGFDYNLIYNQFIKEK
ncbi:MAG: alpha/beta hydrolase [Rickettsiales bacterium]|nr:alpha/beta hydrolase [Rickettsiales bacterium]